MNKAASCRKCGAPVTADARDGVCPRCLFNVAGAGASHVEFVDPLVSAPVSAPDESQILNQQSKIENQEAVLHSFGDFELLEEIARGGMGVVYKARQKSLGRLVAVKLILAGQFAGKQIALRFKSEAIAAAVLQHPNIVAVHEVGVHEGRHFFSMDFVEGRNLTELVAQRPLRPREAARYVKLIAEAIHYAHGQGILHRDLKPSNVLIDTATDQPRVTDFGLAKRLDGTSSLTLTGEVMGSPHFMPPEQAGSGRGKVGRTSDVFGLGGILYFLLTARAPFQGETMEATIEQVLHAEPVSPRLLNPAVTRDLETICLKCLEKEPARRYPTAGELGEELERYLGGEPILARPVSQAQSAWRWCRRQPLIATLACALLLGVVVSTWQAVRATNAEQAEKAQAEQARADRDRAVAAEGDSRIQAGVAKDAWATVRRNAYAAEISAGFQALAENNLGRALELLDRQRPQPGEEALEDLRGFEWRHLWKLCQSDEVRTFEDAGGSGLAFSADGRWLAYAGEKIVVREAVSHSEVKTIPDPATTLAFSPDGKLLASGHDSHVKLWRTESWEEDQSLSDARYPAVFSPDGQWLVTGTADGYQALRRGRGIDPEGDTNVVGGYLVWSTETWEPEDFCAGDPTFVQQSRHAVAFSPDGKLLVTAGHTGGREVGQFQVWDFPSLTVRTNFDSFPFKLLSAAFAPDGKHLVLGDNLGGLMFWDVDQGQVKETRQEHTGGITSVSYARDGRTFATASYDRTIVIWDATNRTKLVRLRGHLGQIGAVAISPDGRTLASGGLQGMTKLWDASTRHETRMLPKCGAITGFSADSRLLVVQGFRPGNSFNGYRLWHLADGAVTTIPLENYVFRGLDTWADVGDMEPYAVFGRINGIVEYWNLATMSRVKSWLASDTAVSTTTLAPDGRFIATSDAMGEIKLWEVASQREVKRFRALGERLTCIRFSPDGRLLAGSTPFRNPGIWIWNIDVGNRIDLDGSNTVSVAFAPDGKLLASAHWDSTVRLWEMPSGRLTATLRGHVQAVEGGVAFSPDGKTLATGGDDGRVKLWNIATKQEMTTLNLPRGGCRSIRFSPDGRVLAISAFLDPEPYIWLWEVPSFEDIAGVEAKETAEIRQP